MPTAAPLSKDTVTFDFNKEKVKLQSLLSDWNNNEKPAVEKRRKVRLFENNVEQKQADGDLQANETQIPRRVIDNNIAKDKPVYVAYIEQATRIVLFKSKTNPTIDATPLADWFTLGMRYPGWNSVWHAASDGSLLHGGVFVEVRIDKSKPLGVALEATPRDCLIFPTKAQDIQRCEKVMRRYEYMPNELEEFVEEYGFNDAQVKKLTDKQKDKEREQPIEVFMVYFKQNKCVYTAWWSEQCDAWLKEPSQLDMALYTVDASGKPASVPCEIYPFFWLPQEILENPLLLAVKGRAFKDLADQDALTGLWSSMVNGSTNAAGIWASQKFNPNNPEGQQNVVMKPGVPTATELQYNNVPYPDPMILTVAQALSGENMAQSGQVDFAVNNRQDSRKTAKEIGSAEKQSGLLSAVRVVPYSNCIRDTYTFVWLIVQSLIATNAVTPPENVQRFIGDDYYVLAAGDSEVIKKAEKIQALQMFYPVVAQSPIGNLLLIKLVELQFPDEAPAWTQMLQQPDLKPLVMQMGQIIAAIPKEHMDPNTAQNIDMILQNAQSVLQQGSVAGGPQQLPAPASNPNPASGPQGAQ